MKPPMPLAVGDQVRLRKPHPCGSTDWHIVRIGADIGLTCDGCGRRILLPRSEVERRIKKVLVHAAASDMAVGGTPEHTGRRTESAEG